MYLRCRVIQCFILYWPCKNILYKLYIQKILTNFNNVINMTGLIMLYDNFIMYDKKIKKMENNILTTFINKQININREN